MGSPPGCRDGVSARVLGWGLCQGVGMGSLPGCRDGCLCQGVGMGSPPGGRDGVSARV